MGRKSVSIDVKKQIIILCDMGIFQHGISHQLKISRRCIRQTIWKYDQFHTVATKPGGGRPRKATDRDKRLIKLQQLRNETLSLTDLVRYANTELNLSIPRRLNPSRVPTERNPTTALSDPIAVIKIRPLMDLLG